MDTILGFFDSAPAWVTALLALVVAAKGVVALTPTPADDKIVGKLYKVLEMIALVVGKAKDKPVQPLGGGQTQPPENP